MKTLAIVVVIIGILVLLYMTYGIAARVSALIAKLKTLRTLLGMPSLSASQKKEVVKQIRSFLMEIGTLPIDEGQAKDLIAWWDLPDVKRLWDRAKRGNAMDDALLDLKDLIDKLRAELKAIDDMKWARKKYDKDVAPTTKKDNDRLKKAEDDAEKYRNKSKIPEAREEAKALRKKTSGRPKNISSAGNCATGHLTSLAFKSGGSLVVPPECCVEMRFSPKLKDTWGDDLQVLASPKNAKMEVKGLTRGRDKATASASDWTSFERDSSDLDEWELPGYSPVFRWVKICNTGSKPFTLKRVRQI